MRRASSRKDIKLGIVLSMAVVLVVGGFYVFRGSKEKPVPLADAGKAVKPPAAPPKTTPSTPNGPNAGNRLANANRNGAPTPNSGPSNPNHPAPTRPPVVPAREAGTPNPVTAANPNGSPLASRSPSTPTVNQPSSGSAAPTAPKPEPASPGVTEIPSATGAHPEPGGDRLANANPPAAGSPSTPATQTPSENRVTSPPAQSPAGPRSATEGPVASNEPAKGLDLANRHAAQPSGPTPARGPTLTAMPPSPSSDSTSNKPTGTIDPRSAAVETHRVQQGDTLVSLAQSYYGSSKYAKFLKDANPGVADAGRLTPGTSIKIPPLPSDYDKSAAKEGSTSRAKSDADGAKTAVVTKGGKRTYTAKSGDSLYKIAKDQLGNAQRWKDVFELNKAALHNDPTQLRVGQTIVLPET